MNRHDFDRVIARARSLTRDGRLELVTTWTKLAAEYRNRHDDAALTGASEHQLMWYAGLATSYETMAKALEETLDG